MRVVVLAGGTGGAKLAAGLQDILGENLTVVANTGDDTEVFGAHVSPDPDLISYWLTGQIDEKRGWGIAGDEFSVFKRLVELGEPEWFGLGDLDLATCLRRGRLLAEGMRPTEAQQRLSKALGADARLLPMCDEPVRTRIRTADGWRSLQEFMAREHGQPEIEEIAIDGIEEATLSDEVAEAVAGAQAVVIGPSNPVISIGPILAVPGVRDAIVASDAAVVAVSPFVAGKALKGPTSSCMRAIGAEPSASAVAMLYDGLIDGLIADSGDPDLPETAVPVRSVPTLMSDAASRRKLAQLTLDFAGDLAA